jgi:hypothetical protein
VNYGPAVAVIFHKKAVVAINYKNEVAAIGGHKKPIL